MFDFNNRNMVIDKLKELNKRNIPFMTLDKLSKIDKYKFIAEEIKTASDEEIEECTKHLSIYCEYGYNDGKDIFSDEECVFGWGLSHGEMVTSDNGMNRKYYHYLTLNRKEHRIGLLLQYHPSGYEIFE